MHDVRTSAFSRIYDDGDRTLTGAWENNALSSVGAALRAGTRNTCGTVWGI